MTKITDLPQHAPSGEQLHGPTSHGPEFWSSECQQPACAAERQGLAPPRNWARHLLVSEVERLRADLAQRTAELELLRAEADQSAAICERLTYDAQRWTDEARRLRSQVDTCQANAHYRAWQESQAERDLAWQQRDQYQAELQYARAERRRVAEAWADDRDQYLAELQRLRVVNQEYADLANTEQVHAANLAEQWQQAQAELQQTRAVVSAARAYVAWWDEPLRPRLTEAWQKRLRALESALDHSPAVGETQERL